MPIAKGIDMKFCIPHWEEVKAAIQMRGLQPLVSKNGEQVIDRMMANLNGNTQVRDPLANVTFAIYTEALRTGGLYLMGADEYGNEFCPLCELDKHAIDDKGNRPEPKASVQWINGSCDAELESCKNLGLVPPPC